MEIHGLCVTKNEGDIIEPFLRAAAVWCDWIYVLDNGSDDGTWDQILAFSKAWPQVVPVGQDPRPFDSGIREVILRRFSHRAGRRDWWCILDADEFYIDDPATFLRQVPRRYRAVWKQEYTYYFTEADLARYRRDPSLYGPNVPIDRRFRYYGADWSEMRFFRHTSTTGGLRIPWSEYRVYPERIRVKHFQYRSPEQIQKRLDTRRAAMRRGSFPHEKRSRWENGVAGGGSVVPGPATESEVPGRWEERVVPTDGLHFDARDGTLCPGAAWSVPPWPPLGERLKNRLASALLRGRRSVRRILQRLGLRRGGSGSQ